MEKMGMEVGTCLKSLGGLLLIITRSSKVHYVNLDWRWTDNFLSNHTKHNIRLKREKQKAKQKRKREKPLMHSHAYAKQKYNTGLIIMISLGTESEADAKS